MCAMPPPPSLFILRHMPLMTGTSSLQTTKVQVYKQLFPTTNTKPDPSLRHYTSNLNLRTSKMFETDKLCTGFYRWCLGVEPTVYGRCPRFRQITPPCIFILTSSNLPIKNHHRSRPLLCHKHHKLKLENQRGCQIVLTSAHAQPIQQQQPQFITEVKS